MPPVESLPEFSSVSRSRVPHLRFVSSDSAREAAPTALCENFVLSASGCGSACSFRRIWHLDVDVDVDQSIPSESGYMAYTLPSHSKRGILSIAVQVPPLQGRATVGNTHIYPGIHILLHLCLLV